MNERSSGFAQVADGRVRIQTFDSGFARRELLGLLFSLGGKNHTKNNRGLKKGKESFFFAITRVLSRIKKTIV